MKTKMIWAAFAAIALAVLPACNSDKKGGDAPGQETYFDMVTLYAQTDQGCTLKFQQSQNSPVITYTSTQKFDPAVVKVGQRVVIAYRMPDGTKPYVSGPIDLIGFKTVINGGYKVMPIAEIQAQGALDGMDIYSMWLTGDYLNIHSAAYIMDAPQTYELVAEKATLQTDMPVLWVIFKTGNEADATKKDLYASFDISTLWSNASYKGFTVKVTNTAGPRSFSFNKTQTQIQPAE